MPLWKPMNPWLPPMMHAMFPVLFPLHTLVRLTRSFSQALLERFIALGTQCAKYLKVTKASEGMFYIQSWFFFHAYLLLFI
jgi:hypothetical protein